MLMMTHHQHMTKIINMNHEGYKGVMYLDLVLPLTFSFFYPVDLAD